MLKEYAEHLRSTYKFNTIPMRSFYRDPDTGEKAPPDFGFDWAKYQSELYDITLWPEHYKAIAIVTGYISGLTIVDIDSTEAFKTLENTIGINLVDNCNYVVKSYRGWQLFYQYDPAVKSITGLVEHVDILNDSKLTFADAINQGYELIKREDTLCKMPPELKSFLVGEQSSSTKTFLKFLQEEHALTYKRPLAHVLEDYLASERLARKLVQKLESIFCTNNFAGASLQDFTKKGRQHDFTMHCAGICAVNPTVDKALYYKFLEAFSHRTLKIPKTPAEEAKISARLDDAFDKLFDYNPKWPERVETESNVNMIASSSGLKVWHDIEEDKYCIMNLTTKYIDRMSKPTFKDVFKRRTGEEPNLDNVEEIYETFEPSINDEFFTAIDGRKFHNNFQRTELMEYFLTCEPRYSLPYHTNQLLHHLFPCEEHRDLFLHNLAFHLKYLQNCSTFIMSGTVGGTGKGVLYDRFLGEIYGKYFKRVETDSFNSAFNGEMSNTLVMYGDEIEETNANASHSVYNKIKNIVGNPKLTIHKKGREKDTQPNHLFLVMSTNKPKPFKVDDNNNRRLNYFPTKPVPIAEEYTDWPSGADNIDRMVKLEVRDFIAYLAGLELSAAKYSKQIVTNYTESLIDKSVPAAKKIAYAMINKNLDVLDEECDEDFVQLYRKNIIDKNISYIKIADIKDHMPTLRKQITDHLKLAGIDISRHYLPREQTTAVVAIINPDGVKHEEATTQNITKKEVPL